jgi:hypothetical protein
MIDNTKDFAAQALQILKEKLSDWRDGPEPVWNSTRSVFERMITRLDETAEVKLTAITGDMHSINKANFTVLHWFCLRFEPHFTGLNRQL